MALIGSMAKQPTEILPMDIVYDNVIGGRTVTSITTTVTTPSGMTKVSEQIAGNILQIYVGGGTSGVSYRWVILTDITIGGRITRTEDEIDVVVLEI